MSCEIAMHPVTRIVHERLRKTTNLLAEFLLLIVFTPPTSSSSPLAHGSLTSVISARPLAFHVIPCTETFRPQQGRDDAPAAYSGSLNTDQVFTQDAGLEWTSFICETISDSRYA